MRIRINGKNVGTVLGQHRGNVHKKIQAIKRLNENLHVERSVARGAVFFPEHFDDALGMLLERSSVGAIVAMNRNTAAAGNKAHDLVTGNRVAATGKTHQNIVDATNHHAVRGVGFMLLRTLDARKHRRHLARRRG